MAAQSTLRTILDTVSHPSDIAIADLPLETRIQKAYN